MPAQKDTFTSLNNFFSFFFPQKQLTDRFHNDIISLWNYQGRSWRHSKSGSGPLVRLPYILLLSLLSTEFFLFWIHQWYNIADVQDITCIVLIDIFDINWNSTWKRKRIFFIHSFHDHFKFRLLRKWSLFNPCSNLCVLDLEISPKLLKAKMIKFCRNDTNWIFMWRKN